MWNYLLMNVWEERHGWGSEIYYISFGITLMGNCRPLWSNKHQLAGKVDNFHLNISCMNQCHLFCYMCTFVSKESLSKNFFRISYTHFQTAKSLCCYYFSKQIILAWTLSNKNSHKISNKYCKFQFFPVTTSFLLLSANNPLFWSYNHSSLHKSRIQDFQKHYAGGKLSIENTSRKEKPLSFCTLNRNLMNPPLILNNIFVTSPKVNRVWKLFKTVRNLNNVISDVSFIKLSWYGKVLYLSSA